MISLFKYFVCIWNVLSGRKSYFLNSDGPDHDAVRKGLLWLIEKSKEYGGGFLVVPVVGNLEGLIQDILGRDITSKLRKNGSVVINGSTIELVTEKKIIYNAHNKPVFALYGGKQFLDKVDSFFDVFVEDTTPPTIDAHADVVSLTNNPSGIVVSYLAPTTHDLVDGDSTAICIPSSGSIFAPGHTQVTCSAVDTHENHATNSFFDVFVELDRISPEAYNQFDPVSKTVKVFGTDNHDGNLGPIQPKTITPTKWNAEDDDDKEDDKTNAELRTYEIKDAAGNKLTLKEVAKLKGKELKVKILSIQYGNDPGITPPKNKKAFEWSTNKDNTIKELEQKMIVGKDKTKQQVEAKYDSKKNKTIIESEKPKTKETLPGLVLLKMSTSNGSLVISH